MMKAPYAGGWKQWIVMGMLLCTGISASAAGTFYVVPGGAGSTGNSWADAFGTIQAAVNAASAAGGGEVWVKVGTYTGSASPIVAMADGVSLYGGFAGAETARDTRDWKTNPTIIDGEDAYRCVTGASAAAIDGFTITKGHVESDGGGGMFNNNCSALTVTHCMFTGNSILAQSLTEHGGGAILNIGSLVTFTDCSFIANSAVAKIGGIGGGAIYNHGSTTVFSNCTFLSNLASAPYDEAKGGALLDASPFAPSDVSSLVNCIVAGNTATGRTAYGGGVNIFSDFSKLTNCTFTANSALASDIALGGALCSNGTSLELTNGIVYGNTASSGYNEIAGGGLISYSCVRDGFSGTGNIAQDPLFIDGTDDGDGFDLRLRGGSPCINTGADTSGTAPASAVDIVGVTRPQNLAYDMGAYEFANLPLAAFSATPVNGVLPLEVTFSDESVSNSIPISGWAWDFGDGDMSTEQNPTHTYTEAGVYAVSLTAKTVSGNDTKAKIRYISVARGSATVSQWPTASAIVYGQPLSTSTLDGGSADVDGSFVFERPDLKPDAGVYTASLKFSPTDSVNYTALMNTVAVTVAPAAPAITTPPLATAVSTGRRLSSSLLVGGAAMVGTTAVAGAFTFTAPSTLLEFPGDYTASVTFTPADTANYLSATGSTAVPVSLAECPDCVETPGPYTVGDSACLIVPGSFTEGASFAWSRAGGTPLNAGRFQGIYCNTLRIGDLEEGDAGVYECLYDDGTTSHTYTVAVVVNPAHPVPAAPGGWKLAGIILLIGMVMAWRYHRILHA